MAKVDSDILVVMAPPEFYVLHLEEHVPQEVIERMKHQWRAAFAPDEAPRLIVIPAGARLSRSDGLPIAEFSADGQTRPEATYACGCVDKADGWTRCGKGAECVRRRYPHGTIGTPGDTFTYGNAERQQSEPQRAAKWFEADEPTILQ